MQAWASQMPYGMMLKSEGFASNLDDPKSALTLGKYCQASGLPYADLGNPVPRKTFASYGLEFQKRFAPGLDTRHVARLGRLASGFEMELSDGDTVTARKVVLAMGLSYYDYVPEILSRLGEDLVTHSSRHSTFDQFRNRDVVVLGAGASAMDVAASLLEAGANVSVVARKPEVRFHEGPAPDKRSWIEELRAPMNGLGPGWRSLACVEAPLLFHMMPANFRLEVTRRHLGPAAGWTTKKQVYGKLPFHLGYKIDAAGVNGGRISLDLAHSDGTRKTVLADHVVAATGFRVDVNRLSFLSPRVRDGIRTVANTPALSMQFESSVPGLYFTGISAAPSFGPLLRFVYGTRFAARRLSRHLAASAAKQYVAGVAAANRQPAGNSPINPA
jgi:hypothetical protein